MKKMQKGNYNSYIYELRLFYEYLFMEFGVIVCPKCKKAKGVNLSSKTTKCLHCRRVISLDKVKILYKTESRQKLQNALGLINADMDGRLADFKKLIKQQ
jgi:hypothetical protein